MKYNDTKTFYKRFVMVPAVMVAAFVLYCVTDAVAHTDNMVKAIDNTMETAIIIEPNENADLLAFKPETKPNFDNTIEVASK